MEYNKESAKKGKLEKGSELAKQWGKKMQELKALKKSQKASESQKV